MPREFGLDTSIAGLCRTTYCFQPAAGLVRVISERSADKAAPAERSRSPAQPEDLQLFSSSELSVEPARDQQETLTLPGA